MADAMKTIVITLPEFHDGEAAEIAEMLRSGKADLIHLRKPESSGEEMERLIISIPANLHSRLVIHDHFPLAAQYGLYGIHLNRRNPVPPEGWSGSISRSCHTLDEVKHWKPRCHYVSLSPIYDSISKQGYRAAFTREELMQAARNGIIDNKVYALGGVTFSRIEEVKTLGFGGAMILGDAWEVPLQPPSSSPQGGRDVKGGRCEG